MLASNKLGRYCKVLNDQLAGFVTTHRAEKKRPMHELPGPDTADGVVLAQCLEQLAKSDGVCIQDAAYQTAPKRLPFEYENLGEREIKGFDNSVRVFAVTLKSGAAAPSPERRKAGLPEG